MATEIHFTKATIEKLPIPKNKDRERYRDDEISALELVAFRSGKKTFCVYKRIGNKPGRIKLGVFPDMSVDNARKAAMSKLNEIAQGINPNDTKRQLRKEVTFDQLFDLFMERHFRVHMRTHKSYESMYNCHLKDKFGNTKISEITTDKIRSFHLKLGERAKTASNRVLELISSMFTKAIEWKLYQGENPAKGVNKFKLYSRDRFLLPDEMPKFFEALSEEPNEIARDYIYMALYTGARKSNVLSMRWDELNLNASQPYWRIPDEKSKNNESMQIPLSVQALEILEDRKQHNPKDYPFVFPGPGTKGHILDPKKAWKRVITKAGVTNLRLHDLRRTLGSWLAASGANSFMIGKALGHKSIKSTAIYARLNLDPVAQSVDIATRAMVEAGKKEPKPSK